MVWLTVWEGWTREHLAEGHDIRTERCEICASSWWTRAKYLIGHYRAVQANHKKDSTRKENFSFYFSESKHETHFSPKNVTFQFSYVCYPSRFSSFSNKAVRVQDQRAFSGLITEDMSIITRMRTTVITRKVEMKSGNFIWYYQLS